MEKRLSFEEYVEYVKNSFEKMGEFSNVKTCTVTKPNGQNYTGLNLHKTEEEENNVTPVINLDEEYKEYVRAGSLVSSIKRIKDVFEESTQNFNIATVNIDYILNYENVKPDITLELINYDLNADYLKDIAHRRFLDLAIVPRISFKENDQITASTAITNKMLEKYNKTADEVIDDAISLDRNAKIASMQEMINSLASGIIRSDNMPIIMYVLTNKNNIKGAACILYANVREKLVGIFGKKFYIIPSSIHELIVLKASEDDARRLASIIQQVNADAVLPAERLSNSLYFYDATKDEFSIAIKGAPLNTEEIRAEW